MEPFSGHKMRSAPGNGIFYPLPLLLLTAGLLFLPDGGIALAGDAATEALELRYHSELAIAEERATGNRALADAMQDVLPGLLQEYLITRDGTVALDAVDAAFVEEQMKAARAMEEPGVALALEVFTGPGTGFENDLRTGLANLADFHPNEIRHVSERALEAHERVMERQMDRVAQDLNKTQEAFARFDAKFEAKLEARLDTATEKLERKTERISEKLEEKAEKITERLEQKAEKAAEKLEEKAEKVSEKLEEKTEQITEKLEEKTEQITEETEEKAEEITDKADEKLDDLGKKPKK